MPRPGPRPYECVRRAWHSDRHQPIRGSLIQEIFRIVNDIHSSATKKNKEWQEKLPIVVLKAEEIMYSKANSEAEYMDLKSLWDRVNDAIDTIIRRDGNTESESKDLLQPCIEAALHLGCSPKRSLRCQRNSSPRYYLTPATTPESIAIHTGNLHDRMGRNLSPNTPYVSQDLKFTLATFMNSESNKMYSFSTLQLPPSVGFQTLPVPVSRPSPDSCSVYPLYYGCQCEPGTDEKEKIVTRNPCPCKLDTSNDTSLADCKDVSENQPVIGCDLSLRLGSVVKKAGDDMCKLSDVPTPQFNRGLSFFLKANADKNQFESSSRKMSSIGQNLSVESILNKRKLVEDQISWPVKLPLKKFRS